MLVSNAMGEISMALVPAALLVGGLLCARQAGRHVGRWFAALAAFTLASGVYISTFHLGLVGLGLCGLLGVVALPLVFGFGVTWAVRELRGLSRLAGVSLVLLVCAAFVALPFQQSCLRFAVRVSRPAMDELVERVRVGESVDVPTRAGLFVVREVKTKGPIVALVIQKYSTGDSALVHFPPGSSLTFSGPMYNLNQNRALDGGWRYQVED